MKRRENTEPLKDVIDQFLKRYRLDHGILQKRIATIWREMLGDYIAEKTSFIQLKNGILLIKLDSAIVRKELDYAKSELKDRINERLGQEEILQIKIK